MHCEILPSESSLELLLEPFVETVFLTFYFGQNRSTKTIRCPLSTLNNEISDPLRRIDFFPMKDGFDVFFDLPEADLAWGEAISVFAAYLRPQKKNNKMLSKSPPIPVQVRTTAVVPLYALAKQLTIARILELLEQSFAGLKTHQAMQVLMDLTEAKNHLSFPHLESRCIEVLSKSLDKYIIPSLSLAPAVLELIIRSPHESDPVSIVTWLKSVYNDFVTTRKHSDCVLSLINKLHKNTPECAFYCWCYSHFLGIDGDDMIMPYVQALRVDRPEMLVPLGVERVMWLLENVGEDARRESGPACVLKWITAHQRTLFDECQRLFEFAFEREMLSPKQISGPEISILLPHADIQGSFVDDLIQELKCGRDLSKWRAAVNSSTSHLQRMSWNNLTASFYLLKAPFPTCSTNQRHSEMNLHMKALDSIFYKWIRNNAVDSSIMQEYLNMTTTVQYHKRFPQRCLVTSSALISACSRTMAYSYIESLDITSWTPIVKRLEKKDLKNPEFLSFLYDFVKNDLYNHTLFSYFIKDTSMIKLLYPYNEKNLPISIDMLSRVQGNERNRELLSMVRLLFYTLSDTQIEALSRVYTVEEVFSGEAIVSNEDTVLYYVLLRGETDTSHVRFSQLSLRAASVSTNCPPLVFSFGIKEDSLVSKIERLRPPSPFMFSEWSVIKPPRKGSFANLPAIIPSKVHMYTTKSFDLRASTLFDACMQYIGCKDMAFHIISDTTDIADDANLLIIWIPEETNVTESLHDFYEKAKLSKKPLIVNARAFLQWEAAETHEEPLTDIVWNDPPPNMLPLKEDLVYYQLSSGKDTFFHSVEFGCLYSKKWSSVMSWKIGRVFAGVLSDSSLGIFNFELVYPDNEIAHEWHVIRVKQSFLCLLSLISNVWNQHC